jgi:FHS family L-fucose permease-like MFS transporter
VPQPPFMKKAITDPKYLVPFILVTSLFFLWAIAHNLNDVLIKQFQKALALSRGESGFIQFAFYLGYFVMALPAGMVMKRWGYKRGILVGLLLYAIGALLFYPAAEVQVYLFFLLALFIIASGLTFLETAANPYITVLGPPETSEQRLNLAQSFNGLGTIMGPLIGGLFIFSGNEYSESELVSMSATELAAYRLAEARMVQMPYLLIGLFLLLLTVVFYRIRMPEIAEERVEVQSGSKRKLLAHRHLVWGVVAQFFYVGAQVCIWSYFIDYMLEADPGSGEKQAAYYLSISLFLFMTGRFIGTWLMRYIAPPTLMALYTVCTLGLLAIGIFVGGNTGVYALMGISFFLSIMFPTIFALSVKGLGEDTKIASSLVIMAIVGGAVFPPLMGFWSDAYSIQSALLVPMACLLVVLAFSLYGYRPRNLAKYAG